MVLIGVGLQTALYGGSITIMSKLMISNLISSLLGLQVIFGVTNGHLSLHFTVGIDYYSLLTI